MVYYFRSEFEVQIDAHSKGQVHKFRPKFLNVEK